MISTSQQNYINKSLDLAGQSTYRFRLGAVIISGGRIIGSGYSKYQNSPKQVADNHLKRCSVHAEMDALREWTNGSFFNGSALKRATIYVARLNKQDEPVLAKPCDRCTRKLISEGITTMVWTIDNNHCGISKVRSMSVIKG